MKTLIIGRFISVASIKDSRSDPASDIATVLFFVGFFSLNNCDLGHMTHSQQSGAKKKTFN